MTEPAGARGYAGFVSRTLAFLVDAVIVTVAVFGAEIGVVLVASVFGAQARDLAHAIVPVFLIALPGVLILYSTAFWALAGRTPGMALLGIRVVRTDGGPVRWGASLIRALVLVCFPVGALWSLVDRRHQAVHDKLARTAVVWVAARSAGRLQVVRTAVVAPRGDDRTGLAGQDQRGVSQGTDRRDVSGHLDEAAHGIDLRTHRAGGEGLPA
jgi:uncharacterized RDD family membrane protein YckC